MSTPLSNEDVAALAERVEAGTIDVQAQIEKFGKDALATIDKLQRERDALRAALRNACETWAVHGEEPPEMWLLALGDIT